MNAFSSSLTAISFHLPQDTKAAKAASRKFVKAVKKLTPCNLVVFRGDGSGLLYCDHQRAIETLSAILPPDAELRLVPVTEKQFEKTAIFFGEKRKFEKTAIVNGERCIV